MPEHGLETTWRRTTTHDGRRDREPRFSVLSYGVWLRPSRKVATRVQLRKQGKPLRPK
jgi:hypothetical protein